MGATTVEGKPARGRPRAAVHRAREQFDSVAAEARGAIEAGSPGRSAIALFLLSDAAARRGRPREALGQALASRQFDTAIAQLRIAVAQRASPTRKRRC
jgi:hypothetical protein